MNDTKQQYDAIVAVGQWSKDTQLQHVIDYLDAYDLSSHFLSYLKLKEAEAPEPSSNYSMEQLLVKLSKSEAIAEAIHMMALGNSKPNPWNDVLVIDVLARYAKIIVESSNELLIHELKIYFNMKHAHQLELLHLPSETEQKSTGKYRWGARGG